MTIKLRKSYKFALRSSLFITLISLLILALLLYFLSVFSIVVILAFGLLVFISSFLTLQYRAERFIYKRVKKISDDGSLLGSSTFRDQPVTTDMKTLTDEIEKFANGKEPDIEPRKERES